MENKLLMGDSFKTYYYTRHVNNHSSMKIYFQEGFPFLILTFSKVTLPL